MTQETVSLNFNTEALKQSLRFAFANDTTVVSELVQNARRAGATKVWITTATGEDGVGQISVLDNGKGLENFQVLLSVATSGWDEEVSEQEGPYGLGFLSCLYAGTHVDVVSKGKILRIDQEGALSDEVFHVERFEGEIANGATTSVTIYGVNLEKIQGEVVNMFRGYPIEVEFDGNIIARPDAIDESFIDTDVGKMKCVGNTYESGNFRVYLQGFQVEDEKSRYFNRHYDVVHLDPKKYFGKFPDRDVVINQKEMIAEVKRARDEVYRQMILNSKAQMEPLEFITHYHKVAEALGMLEVFNDIDVLPRSFFGEITDLPHEEPSWWDCIYLTRGDSNKAFSKKEIEDGSIVVSDLSRYDTGEEDQHGLRWVYAYASKAHSLEERLHSDHWIHDLVKIDDETEVTVRVVGRGKSGQIDGYRTHCVGVVSVVLCDDVELLANGKAALVGEPFFRKEDNCLMIPLANGKPMEISSPVLQQISCYTYDDKYQEEDLWEDVRSVNEMINELSADTVEESVALSLTAALKDYQTLRNMVCTFGIDERGNVKVHAVAKSANDAQAVAAG